MLADACEALGFGNDFLRDGIHIAEFEVLHRAAFGAHDVMMMLPRELVGRSALAEVDALGETGLLERRKGAVDSDEIDIVLLCQDVENLLRGVRAALGGKRGENKLARLGGLQAVVFQNVFGFFFHIFLSSGA